MKAVRDEQVLERDQILEKDRELIDEALSRRKEPPQIGMIPEDERERKTFNQYRELTHAESQKFTAYVETRWRTSANEANLAVANAAPEVIHRACLVKAKSFAGEVCERIQGTIVARCQAASQIRVSNKQKILFALAAAETRLDLARAVICAAFEPSRDSRFYHQLTRDWMRTMCGDSFAWLEDSHFHLWDDIAERFRSAIEEHAIPDAQIQLEGALLASDKNRVSAPTKIHTRKLLIARLKQENPGISARKICAAMDAHIKNAKGGEDYRKRIQPLSSWIEKAGGRRGWGELYDCPETRNSVKTFVDKVKPLSLSR